MRENLERYALTRFGLVFLTIHLLFFQFLIPAGAQQDVDAVLSTLRSNPKLSAPDDILADFANGAPVTAVIIRLQPSDEARALAAGSRLSSQVPPGFTGPGAAIYYNLQDESIRSQLQATVTATVNRVLAEAGPEGITITQKFSYIFAFAAKVTPAALTRIVALPDVVAVDKDHILKAHLAQGIPLINGSTVRSTYTGSGLSIAICDTGIDTSHPLLGGGGFPNAKVIGGYDTGDNDADPRPNSVYGHAHGTACAGIAAGNTGTIGDYIGGVAPDAKLYAIKISTGNGGSAAESAMIAGWEWAVTHKNDDPNNPIMVISTSFGGGEFYSTCDSESPSMTAAAANAVAAGMTIFASAGNDGYCNAMGWPACISYVNSIGAVYDASFGTYNPCVSANSCANKTFTLGCASGWYVSESTAPDKVTAYSNSASFLTLFAPSNMAYTTDIVGAGGSSTGDYYTSFGGTSAACPYTAGAAAVLQQAAKAKTGSYLSPAQVRAYLVDNGDNVTDTKVDITKPRINLGHAVDALSGSTEPNFAIAASPTSVPVAPGSAGITTVTTTVSGGFNNAITLTATGLPTGVTAVFNPTSIPAPGSGSLSLTLSTTSAAPPGSYTVTVTGTGGGITHTATLTLAITGGPTTTLLSDGFEGGGWSAEGAVTWYLSYQGQFPIVNPHGGSRLAAFWSFNAWDLGDQGRLYRSSGFAIPNSATMTNLSFWMYHDTGSGAGDNIQVQVSTDGATWRNVGAAIPRYDGTNGWALVNRDLSAYRGQANLRLGFLGTSYWGSDIYLDDVTVVTQGGSSPDFTIAASPTSGTIPQGGTANSTLTTAVSGGFDNTVSLTATGLPTGAAATFSPTVIAAPGSGSSTMTVTTTTAVPAGAYTVTVTGTGGGITHSATFTLTVIPAPPTYAITGTVHSGSATGPALPAALVSIAEKTATTSGTGTFSIAGIAAGTYTLTISKTGYVTKTITDYVVNSDQTGVVFYLTPVDATPPVVIQFTIPSTSQTLTVPITTFTATDDVAVTGYLVNETAIKPSASDAGWSSTPPAAYTFASTGTKTLYAWAKDAAGNVSTSLSATVVVGGTLPSPWGTVDINTSVAGSASYANGTFTVKGAGANISGTVDGFRYLYQTMSGNGQIEARVASTQNTDPYAKAGVMIRQALAASSAHVTLALTPTSGAQMVYRSMTGGTSSAVGRSGKVAPYWVKLVRDGNTFSSYISADGITWVLVANVTVTMPNSVYVGLAVTSHNTATLCSATFDSVSTSGADLTPPVVTTFAVPSTSSSLTVPISSLIATDDVGVTGYLVNESAAKPLASASGWTSTPPQSYTFTSFGLKTLYAWAKDAAGNVSNSLSATVTVTAGGLPSPWSSQDINTLVPGSASYAGGTFTVSGAGANIAGMADGFQYLYQPMSGNGEIVARVITQQNTDPYAKAGVMFRQDLTANSQHVTMALTPTSGAQLLWRTGTGGSTSSVGRSGKAAPYWLKVVRNGNTFSSFMSADGVNWAVVSNTTVAMSNTIYVGLAVTSHNTGAVGTATFDSVSTSGSDTISPVVTEFTVPPTSSSLTVPISKLTATDNVGVTGYLVNESATKPSSLALGWTANAPVGYTFSSAGSKTLYAWAKDAASNVSDSLSATVTVSDSGGLPGPWASQDINTSVAGSATYANGAFTVNGAGANIGGTADGFHFVYQMLAGDGQVVARVASQQNADPYAKGGVMFRETLTADSVHVTMALTPTSGAQMIYRSTAGGTTSAIGRSGIAAPYWVKLVRSGNAFTAYMSADGASWVLVQTRTVTMASTVYVGLAVTSHNTAALGTATFDNALAVTTKQTSP